MAGIKKQVRGRPGWRQLLAERLREASLHAPRPSESGVRRHFAVMANFDAKAGSRLAAEAAALKERRRAEVELERRRARLLRSSRRGAKRLN